MNAAQDDPLLALLQKALGHELPNRLVAIQGFVQLLQLEESEHLSPDGKEFLRRLAAATQRTAAVIKELADLVRNRRTAETVEKIALADVLREAVVEAKQLCPTAKIEYDFPEAGPLVRLSRAALRRVAVQLLRNAAQAAVPSRPLGIVVGARDGSESVEFWVADNGRGLAPEQVERLQGPIAGAGPGLGLALVRLTLQSWGGSLQVTSEPDGGSTFRVVLPKGGS